MNITIDLFKDFVEVVRDNYKFPDEMSDHSVIMHYFDLLERHIPQQKWDVKISKEILYYSDEIKNAVKSLEKEARAGSDLSKYLSTYSMCPNKKDKLLIHWGINHLHFGDHLLESQKAKCKEFANRTDELLFIFRDESTLYFLDVMKHSKKSKIKPFIEQKLLYILESNWPGISSVPNKGIEIKTLTNKEVEILREKNCTTLHGIDSNIHISPYIGTLKSGNSIMSLTMEKSLKLSLDKWSAELLEQKDVIIELIESAKSIKCTEFSLRLVNMHDSFDPEWIIVKEISTGLQVRAHISAQLTLELLLESHTA